MSFRPNDKVYAISDPSRIGIVERLGLVHAGQQYYFVFWGGSYGTRTVGEYDLRLQHSCELQVMATTSDGAQHETEPGEIRPHAGIPVRGANQ